MIDRRRFLQVSAMAGGGLILAFRLVADEEAPDAGAATGPFEPNAYIEIHSDGRIRIYSKNPEIGQGVKTSMPMIVAEELGADWNDVVVEQAPLDSRYGAQFAGGSMSITSNWMSLRRAGAAARHMLIATAARRWSVDAGECSARASTVTHAASGRTIRYGDLAASAAEVPVPDDPVLETRETFDLIGSSKSGVDNAGIVTGQPLFGIDAAVDGMLYAVIARCPVFGGTVRTIDDTQARKLPGVRNVIPIEPMDNPTQRRAGVAVLADSTWAAWKGRDALRIEWDPGTGASESSEAIARRMEDGTDRPGRVLRDDGDVDGAFRTAARTLAASYQVPFLSHTPMEPMNYIAHVRKDGCDLIGPTQVPGSARALAARITGLPPETIRVTMTRVGGGFGRRLMADYAAEAVTLSMKAGTPVQVIWTREDEIRHDYYRPAGLHRFRAALDGEGKLIAWHVSHSSASRYLYAGSDESPHKTEIFPDGFPAQLVENFRMEYKPVETVVSTGAWRAPGHNATAFADQCFLDEIAHAAGKDPIQMRLDLLGPDRKIPYDDHGGPYTTGRFKQVLERVRDESSWAKPLPSGRGRGVAAHFTFGSYAALVAEATAQSDGKVRIERIVAVVDCGTVVNRSGAEAQVEGGIIDGLGAAIHGEIRIENGRVVQSNFDDYPLIRIEEVPRIDVIFIDSTEPAGALGEVSLPPVAPAVCNAIFAATGRRIRTLPIARAGVIELAAGFASRVR